MDEFAKQEIKEYADAIRKDLQESGIATLFGYPFDPSNPDCILVAAVGRAAQKERDKHSRELDFLFPKS